jgi:hypothetical protein
VRCAKLLGEAASADRRCAHTCCAVTMVSDMA